MDNGSILNVHSPGMYLAVLRNYCLKESHLSKGNIILFVVSNKGRLNVMNALKNYFSDIDTSCYSNRLIVSKLWEYTIQLFLFNANFSTTEMCFEPCYFKVGFEAMFKYCPQTLVVNNICFLQMSDRKAVIKNADMSEDMQQDAVEISTQAMEKFNIEKDIAAYVKKEFDKKYNPTWHCIVGRNFGSYVTHETKHFIYFYLGQVAVLLFKSG